MPKHILVAEDEVLIAMLVQEHLTEAGYRVTVAGNGEEALQAWGRDRADAVVTDLSMPKMNGVELAHRLREREPTLPVLVVTGYADLATGIDDLRAAAPQITMVLQKPAPLTEVEREVARLLAAGELNEKRENGSPIH